MQKNATYESAPPVLSLLNSVPWTMDEIAVKKEEERREFEMSFKWIKSKHSISIDTKLKTFAYLNGEKFDKVAYMHAWFWR